MKYSQLLAINSDAKTYKGVKFGYLTGILYLAPSTISGYQTCSMAKIAQCEKACLYTAGRGKFNSTQLSRINKTKYLFEHREEFLNNLSNSINKVIKKAKRLNLEPLIRLNGTSDILWENIRFKDTNLNIFETFPNIQFYDYTKIPNRKNIPSNYDLTFSYSGVKSFQKYLDKGLNNKNYKRIAVVFKKPNEYPVTFLNRKVINGDNSDIRHIEPNNTIVALYAKGDALKDNSGFVINN